MNAETHTAAADQLSAEVRDARCCDALNPCRPCQVKTMTARTHRHLARVAQAEMFGSAAHAVPAMSGSVA